MSSRTLEAVIYAALLDLFATSSSNHEIKDDNDGSSHTYYKIENSQLCESVRIAIGGEDIAGKRAFLSTEFDKVTHNRILKRCRDIFKAKDDWKGSGNDKTRALRFDKEIVLKVGSTFEVISEIKILENADYANDDQTIWKDWDSEDASEDSAEGKVDPTTIVTTDNHISTVSTATDISVRNKAVIESGNASTITPAIGATTDNNNLGTMGQLYSDLGHIQPSKSTKSEDHAAKAKGNTDIYSTTCKIESHNKLENIPDSNVNIADNKLTSNLAPVRTNTLIQNDHVYLSREQKVVPLSQSNISRQEIQIEGSKSKTKSQSLGLPSIPCIFCYNYKTPIEFDLGNHLLESHRMDLVKLSIGRGNMEYRINHAIQLGKRGGDLQ